MRFRLLVLTGILFLSCEEIEYNPLDSVNPDYIPPETTITSDINATTLDTSAVTITFEGNEGVIEYSYSADSSSWSSWISSTSYKMEYLDDVINNFGTEFTDDGYIKRIKDKKIHEKYKNISAKGISSAISDITGFEYELTAADDGGEDYTPIKVYRMLDPNYQPQRRSFMLEGYLKKGCVTVIAGEPGVSKTQFLIQMAYSHISGYEFFNKKRGGLTPPNF